MRTVSRCCRCAPPPPFVSLSGSQGSNILLLSKAQVMLLANVLSFVFAHRPKPLGLGGGGAAVTWVRLSSASHPSLSFQARGQEPLCISPSLWAASTPSLLSSWPPQPLRLPTQLIRPSCRRVFISYVCSSIAALSFSYWAVLGIPVWHLIKRTSELFE